MSDPQRLRLMNKIFGWDLPAGAANDPRAPWNEQEHDEKCPQHQDFDHSECCDQDDTRDVTARHDCECGDIAEQIESDRAEAAYEARREGLI